MKIAWLEIRSDHIMDSVVTEMASLMKARKFKCLIMWFLQSIAVKTFQHVTSTVVFRWKLLKNGHPGDKHTITFYNVATHFP